jgi:hypothetical protein
MMKNLILKQRNTLKRFKKKAPHNKRMQPDAAKPRR